MHRRRRPALVGTAVLTAFGTVALAACGASGTGTRDEGPARTDVVSRPTPSPSPAATSSPAPSLRQGQVVRMLRDDPEVSEETKDDLKPCGRDYPVDVSLGDLTRGAAPDVLVNVMTCGDAVGVATYVYRVRNGSYVNVFQAEDPPVYAEIDRGDLVVTKQLYRKGDPVAYPSSEEVITYAWRGGVFKETYRLHNDYSKAVGGDDKSGSTGN